MKTIKAIAIALVACFVTSGCGETTFGKTAVKLNLAPHQGTLGVHESGPWERKSDLDIVDSNTPFERCKDEHTPDLVAHHKDGRIYADAYCACKIYGGFDDRCPLNPRFRMYGGMVATNIPYGPGISVAGLSGSATPTGATTNAQAASQEPASKDAVKYLMTVFEDHDRRLGKVEDASDATAKLATALMEQPSVEPKPPAKAAPTAPTVPPVVQPRKSQPLPKLKSPWET